MIQSRGVLASALLLVGGCATIQNPEAFKAEKKYADACLAVPYKEAADAMQWAVEACWGASTRSQMWMLADGTAYTTSMNGLAVDAPAATPAGSQFTIRMTATGGVVSVIEVSPAPPGSQCQSVGRVYLFTPFWKKVARYMEELTRGERDKLC